MIKVAINGFGRIGRLSLRKMLEEKNVKVVAINDLTDSKMLSYLFKYDTAEGIYNGKVSYDDDNIIINEEKIKIFKEMDPENLPWKDLDIDIVLECTGAFTTIEKANKHILAGAKKVIISAPSIDAKTIVYNVNHNEITKEDNIISAASCTTNCLAPVLKLIDDNYGIKIGYMSTILIYLIKRVT